MQDPLRAAQLLAEHSNFAAAISQLLEAAAAAEERLPSAALRLLHELVVAAGSPASVAATWRQLQQAENSGSSSLEASLPRMRADLAARLAHQLAALHPLTSTPLQAAGGAGATSSGSTAAAGGEAAALEAGQLVAASQPDGDAAGAGGSSGGSAALQLAARLASFAQEAYRRAGLALGELRCVAVAAAAGAAHAMPADALLRGLHLAGELLSRFGLAAAMSGVPGGWRRRPTEEQRRALLQVEELFQLTGLADAAAGAARGGGVTCPRNAPGLRALADLLSSGAAQHGGKQQLRLERRKLMPAAGAARQGAAELLAADVSAVEAAAAFYLFKLSAAATMGVLTGAASPGMHAGLMGNASLPAAPPGLAVARQLTQRPATAAAAAAALEALGTAFKALDHLQRLQREARKVFPQLRLASQPATAQEAGLGVGGQEQRLVDALLQALFPAGKLEMALT